nr:glycerate kinase [Pseudanabaena sp. PCC 7367]
MLNVFSDRPTPNRLYDDQLDRQNIGQFLEQRLNLLAAIYPEFQACQRSLGITSNLLEPLWQIWLPLALKIASTRQKYDRPLIQGILGGQGTGKTTLCKFLALILKHLGHNCLSISIDDLYKTYADRQQLQQQDPRLIWRGPPGTHDLELGIALLDQLRAVNDLNPLSQKEQYIAVPQFDKTAFAGAGDRTEPLKINLNQTPIDIVLFEGWMVGVWPWPEADLAEVLRHDPPSPIATTADVQFALDMNRNLQAYLPLWQRLDSLIMLHLVDFNLSKQWRKEAEQKAIAAGKTGMGDREVEQFVNYFWRALHPDLFIKPLAQNPEIVDLVIEVGANHLPIAVY